MEGCQENHLDIESELHAHDVEPTFHGALCSDSTDLRNRVVVTE